MIGKIRAYFSWLPPPSTMILSVGDVHVWLVDLYLPAIREQQLAQSLIEKEHIRAERFHFKRDKRRFIVRRAVLRMILGGYLQIEPNQIQLSCGPYGKPFLAEKHGDGTMRFNLAHSNELALYVFTRGREIGIDIEYIRTLPDLSQISDTRSLFNFSMQGCHTGDDNEHENDLAFRIPLTIGRASGSDRSP